MDVIQVSVGVRRKWSLGQGRSADPPAFFPVAPSNGPTRRVSNANLKKEMREGEERGGGLLLKGKRHPGNSHCF